MAIRNYIYLLTFTCIATRNALQIGLSNRLCMGSWPCSSHSSGSADTAKTSKRGTNSPNMQFKRSWVGSHFSFSKYLRSSCCLLFWHLTVWWFFWRSYFHRACLPFILNKKSMGFMQSCCDLIIYFIYSSSVLNLYLFR